MYYVEALTQKRQAEWDGIFGMTTLPVQGPTPVMTPGQRLAYRLNAAALGHNHVMRLVGWLVMHRGFEYDVARKEVLAGFPITADETVQLIVKNHEQSQSPRSAHWFYTPLFSARFVRSLY